MAANTYGRQVTEALTNKSGGSVAAGDVVVIDTANNDAFTTSTAGSVTISIGIAQETIANNAVGRILTSGYAALVNVNASVTRGNYGKTFTVAKQATDAGASRVTGAFCQFLTGGTTPTAHVFGVADAPAAAATGGLVLLEQHTASASATLDFTTCITATYDEYEIHMINLIPATDSAKIGLRMSTDAGVSYDSGSNYSWEAFVMLSTATGTNGSTSDTALNVHNGVTNAQTYQSMSGKYTLFNPASTVLYKGVLGLSIGPYSAQVGNPVGWHVAGFYKSATAVNAFRVLATAGNITSGVVRVYGVAKT